MDTLLAKFYIIDNIKALKANILDTQEYDILLKESSMMKNIPGAQSK